MRFPIEELKEWFLENKRDLPWRHNHTPYRVWVSEIMLQQTQAVTVIPYFERWMRCFPSIEVLANASKSEVVKMWEGLGYYSRAVNLHEGAKICVEQFGGNLPTQAHELLKIKGIGPYTCGAILSFAFHKKAAAIDGNVLRFLARFFAIRESIDLSKTQKQIEKHVLELLPDFEPWIIAEAMIEMGATVCQKEPQCQKCPLQKQCLSYRDGLTKTLPTRKLKTASIALYRAVAIIQYQGEYLLKKGEEGQVMGELYEFPYLEIDENHNSTQVQDLFEKHLSLKLEIVKKLPQEKHSFTKYRATLFPYLFELKKISNGHFWHKNPSELPFSSGHRRILQRLIAK